MEQKAKTLAHPGGREDGDQRDGPRFWRGRVLLFFFLSWEISGNVKGGAEMIPFGGGMGECGG